MEINWDGYDHLLGTLSDTELARMIGVSAGVVKKRRQARGIPPAMLEKKLIDWNDYDHLFGSVSDVEMSRRIGCPVRQVKARRRHLGLPGHTRCTIDWSKYDHLLGTMTDAALSRQVGCSATLVSRRRKQKEILPFGATSQLKKNPETFWKTWDPLLGKITDSELARKAGVAVSTVTTRRRKKGVAAHRTSKAKTRDFLFLARSDNWPWDKTELGGFEDMLDMSHTTSRNAFRARVDIDHLNGLITEYGGMDASCQTYHYSQLYGEPVYYLHYKGLVFVYALQKFWRR